MGFADMANSRRNDVYEGRGFFAWREFESQRFLDLVGYE